MTEVLNASTMNNDSNKHLALRVLLALIALGTFGIILQSSTDVLASRFGRADILWTTIVWMVPAAIWFLQQAFSRLVRGTILVLSGLCAWVVWSNARASGIDLLTPFAASQLVLLMFTISVSCLLPGRRRADVATAPDLPYGQRMQRWLTGGSVLLAAILLPHAYAHLAAQSQLETMEEALQDQRFLRARRSATVLLCCQPTKTVLQQPVAAVASELDARIQVLENLAKQPLPQAADTAAIGQRVVALMQLDRNEAALDLIRPLTKHPEAAPVVLDYCGLCCQRLQLWEDSGAWYEQSLQFWQQQPASQQRASALTSAWKGIAFAERRLDQSANAEKTYLTALETVPSAELHFLLAMHYEDQQRTSSAAQHVRQAMAMDPATYRRRGQELLDRMSHSHIGCLQTSAIKSP